MNNEESTNIKNDEQAKKSASRLIEKTTVPKTSETMHNNKEESSKDVQRTSKTTLEYLVDVMKVNENNSKPGILEENVTQTENLIENVPQGVNLSNKSCQPKDLEEVVTQAENTKQNVTQTENLIENVPQSINSSNKSFESGRVNEDVSQSENIKRNVTQTENLIQNVPQSINSSNKSFESGGVNEDVTQNENLNASENQTEKSNTTTSKQNDPSVILGAACALSSNIPELIKDIKKNTTTASTFDVFIVNEEGKINSYEINHYVEEDINNQLYSTIKTPSEKKDSYQKKLRNIVNEIKHSKIEPIKENEPTILEISHYDDIEDNVLVICYCGNGIQSDNCMCTREKKNEDKFSSCSELSDEEPLITKSAFDSSSEEISYEISNEETTISNENSSLRKKESLNTVLEGDNMSLNLVEEKLPSVKNDSLKTVLEGDNMSLNLVAEKTKFNQTCEPPCPIEHHQKSLNNAEKDSYGLSKEWERMISNKEDNNPNNQIIVEQMIVNNSQNNSNCSMGTHTLAEALNVNESEIIVNELVEHNTELLKKESLHEEVANDNPIIRDLSCEESSEVIILHENLKSQIKERSCNATKSNLEKPSTLIDFDIKNVRSSNSQVPAESVNTLKACPIESSGTQEKSVSQHQTENATTHKSSKPCPIESSGTQEKSVSQHQTENATTHESLKACPIESSGAQEKANSQSSHISTSKTDVLHPSASNLSPSIKDKSTNLQQTYASTSNAKTSKTSSTDVNSSVKKESVVYSQKSNISQENKQNLSNEESANYVEIEIHLSDNNQQRSEVEANNSLITFIENDKANYSQTLQNIRKNRVGSLVSFYEELNKKSKEDK